MLATTLEFFESEEYLSIILLLRHSFSDWPFWFRHVKLCFMVVLVTKFCTREFFRKIVANIIIAVDRLPVRLVRHRQTLWSSWWVKRKIMVGALARRAIRSRLHSGDIWAILAAIWLPTLLHLFILRTLVWRAVKFRVVFIVKYLTWGTSVTEGKASWSFYFLLVYRAWPGQNAALTRGCEKAMSLPELVVLILVIRIILEGAQWVTQWQLTALTLFSFFPALV